MSHHHEEEEEEEYSKIRYLEKDHIPISLITVYCYNCSSLLLVIIINPLLCLLYKLNFITGMHA